MIEFRIEHRNTEDSRKAVFIFRTGVIGFYCRKKEVYYWEQLKGWVYNSSFDHGDIDLPVDVRNRAIEHFRTLGLP